MLYTPVRGDLQFSRETGKLGVTCDCRNHMSRNIKFRHDLDKAAVAVLHNLADVVLRIETAFGFYTEIGVTAFRAFFG